MKILNASQVYMADQATLKSENIESFELMERVGVLCYDWILENLHPKKDTAFYIFCGVGNNGGDGLVIGRHLLKQGHSVNTYIVNFSKNKSTDFLKNLKNLKAINHTPYLLNNLDVLPKIPSDAIVIDTIFGLGLKRPPKGIAKRVIEHINASGAFVLAIDFPSGLYADTPVEKNQTVVEAQHTITFQCPKIAFLFPDNQNYTVNWEVLSIGLNPDFIASLPSNYTLTLQRDILDFHKERKSFSHKGTFGHALLIGGSYGKMGAVVLSAKAANVVGSGLVTSLVPKCGYAILQTSVPEAMTLTSGKKAISNFENTVKSTAIGIGMGMGLAAETQKAFCNFVSNTTSKLVLDADALNCLSQNKGVLAHLPKDTILTPHPKELERLIGMWKNDYKKLEKVKEFSAKYKLIVVIKGAFTTIVEKEKCYFNSTGNPALATGGSGDVLTGMITGLLAQNYTPLQAAIMGVYLHGSTADIAILKNLSQEAFTASDIINYLPEAFRTLQNID
ncbi:MAG: NAD(P)H-hydrate dehydratase [Flavobacteriaceae bacterium]|nr:NAD(P)H-hydrate dehydratase [Flavobacteriaceae bacterium]